MEETSNSPSSDEGDHEEFTPKGTFAMLGIYFVILTLMWFFMYFVEFLGKGPTVIG